MATSWVYPIDKHDDYSSTINWKTIFPNFECDGRHLCLKRMHRINQQNIWQDVMNTCKAKLGYLYQHYLNMSHDASLRRR